MTGADIVARHPRFPAENTVPGTWREPRLFGPSSPSAAGGQIESNLDRLPSQSPSRPRGNANQRRAGGQGQRTRLLYLSMVSRTGWLRWRAPVSSTLYRQSGASPRGTSSDLVSSRPLVGARAAEKKVARHDHAVLGLQTALWRGRVVDDSCHSSAAASASPPSTTHPPATISTGGLAR